jgi:cell division transport system permease protein
MIWKFTIRHLLSRPFSAFLTMAAVAVSLSLLGGFWTVVENLERVRLSSVKQSEAGVAGLTVFMDPKLGEAGVENFRKDLLTDKRFSKATVVPPEEALAALQRQFGEALSKAFEGETLPTTVQVEFAPGTMRRDDFMALLNQIRGKTGVLDVDDGLNLFDDAESQVSTRVFSWATGLLLLVFVVVALLVSHLIRLAFESLRNEIETLKILGASKTRIFAPLLLEGLIFGVGGVLLSLGFIAAFFEYLVPNHSLFLLPKDFEMVGLSIKSSLSLAGLGVLAAVSGALLTWPLIDQPAQEL